MSEDNFEVSTLDRLQQMAVSTFVRFIDDQLGTTPENEKEALLLQSDVKELKKLLPLADIVLILEEEASESNEHGFLIGADNKEEFDNKLRELTAKLVARLMSNMMHYGAKHELLDVSFEEENGFVFTPTEKARPLFDAYEKILDSREKYKKREDIRPALDEFRRRRDEEN